MDDYLKEILDSFIYNSEDDWDFMIPVSGDGMVRVGKSMLCQQIGYYWSFHIGTPFTLKNVVFNGEELVKVAKELPPRSCIVYDEARGGLDSKRTMSNVVKALLDFFAECGMYNHLILLALPDFFDLPASVAIHRSECLINVMRGTEKVQLKGRNYLKYVRGQFEFYGRNKKRDLYIAGKKQNGNYRVVKANWFASYRKHWVLSEDAYKKKKQLHLDRDRNTTKPTAKQTMQRDVLIKLLVDTYGWDYKRVAKLLSDNGVGTTSSAISTSIYNLRKNLLKPVERPVGLNLSAISDKS